MLVERLHELGVDERLVLIDNGSTYEPLRDWLAGCDYPVIRLEENLGPHVANALRESGKLYEYAGVRASEHIAYTDPDVIPCAECPADFLEIWRELLDSTDIIKVGFALRIDDLPDTYPLKSFARNHESVNWNRPIGEVAMTGAIAYHGFIDTTFALVRAGRDFRWTSHCLRTSAPYWARHMTWYETPDTCADDIEYYRNRVGGSWSTFSGHGRRGVATERL